MRHTQLRSFGQEMPMMSPSVGAGPLAWRPRPESPPVSTGTPKTDDPELKRQRKEARILAEASRALDPWERYRALVDALEESFDLSEMADRKVRFALVVMTGLSAGLFAMTTRPELIGPVPARLQDWLGAYLLAYALVGVYFFLQAVEALRPRPTGPRSPGGSGADPYSPGLRDPERVSSQDVLVYERAWREVRFDQLNAELARQNHALAGTNREKWAALGRLYGGLKVLALLLGGLVALVSLSAAIGRLWS